MHVCVLLSINFLSHAVGPGSSELCLCGLHYAGELNMHRYEGVVWSDSYGRSKTLGRVATTSEPSFQDAVEVRLCVKLSVMELHA